MGNKLNPPVLDNKAIAQSNPYSISIPFLMNRSVGWADFDSVCLIIKTVQSNKILTTLSCAKESLVFKDGKYWGAFNNSNPQLFKVGQHYKAQMAYKAAGEIGFYSQVTTFKFTSKPTLSIQKLALDKPISHFYNYTGVYTNDDASEKVYSYEFNLYNNSNKLVASSGEQLHNSSLDTSTNMSIDEWVTRYALEPQKEYLISYKIKTVNGLEATSPSYRIIDNWNVRSNLFTYCRFIATNIFDSACIELSLHPKENGKRKFINGQFVLLRSSSEDDFQSWQELTRFILASHDTSTKKIICRDYCVAQGVTYRYALQAYNNKNVYSIKEIAKDVIVDFEDMFLTDGERQLRVQFNPKISSFKNTILESKIDTIGGKYPFFVRNGNVEYKEFPISGLITMIMDQNSEFLNTNQPLFQSRKTTPASNESIPDLSTALTGDNFRKEREFKLEVLKWLTNGQPKLFRSPGEGNYLVRLMNISLSPNDTLSRMLHTFNCTAYEMAEYNFENLQKYNIMMPDYLETRELKFENIHLEQTAKGLVTNLNACVATLHALPGTAFRYKLKNNPTAYYSMEVGATGVFVFQNSVLAENPLMEICPISDDGGADYWKPEATLTYARYLNHEIDNFSYIDSISVTDVISQWVGTNENEIDKRLGDKKLLKSIGLVYYLSVYKRHIVNSISSVEKNGVSYIFKEGDVVYHPGNDELIYFNEEYYDGATGMKIGKNINFEFQLRHGESRIDLSGINTGVNIGTLLGCENATDIGGRIVLTNVSDVDCLYLGNGLCANIAYQEVEKIYTVEVTPGHPIKIAKDNWESSKSLADWEIYYDLLESYLQNSEEALVEDALQ